MSKSSELLDAFVKEVNSDKSRSQYLEYLDYPAEEVTDGNEFFFIPYTPVVQRRLSNGGSFYVRDHYVHNYDFDKNGYIHHVERTPIVVVTPSGYVYDGDTIEKDGKIVYWDILELTKNNHKSIRERKLERDLLKTVELARAELRNIADAWNWVVGLRIDMTTLRARRVSAPRKARAGIRVNVRKMF